MLFVGLVLIIVSVVILFKMGLLTEVIARDLVQHIRRTDKWERTSDAYSDKIWKAHLVSAACGVAFSLGMDFILTFL